MAVILSDRELDSLVEALADRVITAIAKRGIIASDQHVINQPNNFDALVSLLTKPAATNSAPRGRFVSEGMMNLASAVAYKLGKADPEKAQFNHIASEVAKLLYNAKRERADLPVHDTTDKA